MARHRLNIKTESRIRWRCTSGSEASIETGHDYMRTRRQVLSLHCKSPDLTMIAYNHMLNNMDKYGQYPPRFCFINFDDPEHSHRCNPYSSRFHDWILPTLTSRHIPSWWTWTARGCKAGDFFVESPIVLFAAIIWYLKRFENGKYCTFPHAIEFLCRPYEQIFPDSDKLSELENYLSPFIDAWQGKRAGTASGTDSIGKDSSYPHDFAAVILDYDRGWFHLSTSTDPEGAEDTVCRQ